MKLRTLLSLLFVGIMALFTLLSLLVKNGVLLREFYAIERSLAQKEMARVLGALAQEEAALRVLTTDWGVWNDTYAFMADGNEEYIASNLTDVSFYSSRVDLFYFVANSGRVVWSRAHDIQAGADITLAAFPAQKIAPDNPLLLHPPDKAGSRLILSEHGPMLIAAIDVQPSSGKSESRGTLVMGRLLSAPILDRLQEQTRENFAIWPLTGQNLPPAEQAAAQLLSQQPGPLVTEVSDSQLHVYDRYGDTPPGKGVLVRVVLQRHMLGQAAASLTLAGTIFWGVGLLLLSTAYVALRRWLLQPLMSMNQDIVAIRQQKDLGRRLEEGGVTEVRGLLRQFNGLLADLEENDIQEKAIQEKLATARQEAEVAASAKAKFLANMSHEIRTPMNGIIGLTELFGRTQLDKKQRGYLEKIIHSSKLLLAIINDILDFSKLEAGKLKIESVPFALQDVFDTVTSAISIGCEKKGLELLLDVEEAPRTLRGDPLRLSEVLINLTANAMKFTHQGQIVISARRLADGPEPGQPLMVEFSVQDSGIGLSGQQMATIFKSFSQADSSVSRKYGGSGLGLSICASLVKVMGGEIRVDSSPGQGSTFTFTAQFAAQEKGEQREDLAPLCPPALLGSKALVVDDNAVARRIHSQILTCLGFQVQEASSGHEALEIMDRAQQEERFKLILLGWKMAGLDGVATARAMGQLQSAQAPPMIIMVSAYGLVEEIKGSAAAGIALTLHKPITAARLCDLLKELFAEEEAAANEPEQARNLTGKKVLVVDDVDLNLLVARELLEQAGCQVSVADNGQDAITLAREAAPPFDLVLMDVQMPGLDGYETTRRIRDLPASATCDFKKLPIVAMTAHAMAEERERCRAAGMDDHLTKPFAPQELLALVRKWTGE
ncbi:MAG: response regulator [Thermodesulfobacteriota bacterium]